MRCRSFMKRSSFIWGGNSARAIRDRKSTRLNSSHLVISYAVFCLKKKKETYRCHFHVAKHIGRLYPQNLVYGDQECDRELRFTILSRVLIRFVPTVATRRCSVMYV